MALIVNETHVDIHRYKIATNKELEALRIEIAALKAQNEQTKIEHQFEVDQLKKTISDISQKIKKLEESKIDIS